MLDHIRQPDGRIDSAWVKTADLLKILPISRTTLERLRKEEQVFSPGDHYLAIGKGPRSGFLWNQAAVIQRLADLASQNDLDSQGDV